MKTVKEIMKMGKITKTKMISTHRLTLVEHGDFSTIILHGMFDYNRMYSLSGTFWKNEAKKAFSKIRTIETAKRYLHLVEYEKR